MNQLLFTPIKFSLLSRARTLHFTGLEDNGWLAEWDVFFLHGCHCELLYLVGTFQYHGALK